MEKLNLLEKLKTLKQWQLQQQQLQSENVELYRNNMPQAPSNRNQNIIASNFNTGSALSKLLFNETIRSDKLLDALKNIKMDLSGTHATNSPTSHHTNILTNIYNDEDEVDCGDGDGDGEDDGDRDCDGDDDIDDGEDDGDDDDDERNDNGTKNDKLLQNGSLQNWYLSDMKTVVFNKNKDGFSKQNPISESDQQDIEGENDWKKNKNSVQNNNWHVDDLSDDVNSDIMEGVHPLPDTEEDNNSEFSNGDNVSYEENDGIENGNEQDKNNTVIENRLDEKPIKTGGIGLTFEQLVERELKNEQKQLHNISASTPLKKKGRSFLRRGEGLKRFENGSYVKQLKEKMDKKNVQQTKKQDFTRPKPLPGISLKLNKKQHFETKSELVTNKEKIKNVRSVVGQKHLPEVKESTQERSAENSNTVNKNNRFSSVSSSILENSFQTMLAHYKEKEELEENELDMFEALEEAAQNISLSSNSSLVARLLGRGSKQQKQHNKNNDLILEEKIENNQLSAPGSSQHDEAVTSEDDISGHFDDADSWSDTSQISSVVSVNDDTITNEEMGNSIVDDLNNSTDHAPPPLKRVISKRKEISPENLQQKSLELESNDITDTVKRKLAELENEISKFRLENEKLSKLRLERESDLKKLRKEIDDFQTERTEELKQIDHYRDEEMKKLKVERKVFDKYQKAARAMPNKKEREEIALLKEQLSDLQDELKSRESRWNAASHRFRSRINELEGENAQLREEIKVFEQERLLRRKGNEKLSTKRLSNSPDGPTKAELVMKKSPMNKNSLHFPASSRTSPRFYSQSHSSTPNESTKVNIIQEPVGRIQSSNLNTSKEIRHDDGKVEMLLPDGSRLVSFPNGTKKTISADDKTVSVAFFNGDIKKILPGQKIVYFYAESETTHTTFPDGLEMLEFPNKQVEKRYPDGRVEIVFPDKTVKYISPNGCEETVFSDGTIQSIDTDDVTTITFTNGQKEIHTKQYKRREYPNGTVKTVYNDGRQETKYSNGRLRVKDKEGHLLIDTAVS